MAETEWKVREKGELGNMITIEDIKKNKEVLALINAGEKQLIENGYTEHSTVHVGLVSKNAGSILQTLCYSERQVELAKIAGFMHDIGNAINRTDHAHSGAILAYNILSKLDMPYEDIAEVILAIGHHDEKTGDAVSAITAALILADKADVRRSRVRNTGLTNFHIHDRVNFAVTESNLNLDLHTESIILDLNIDTKMCPVMDYFEIFLNRMTMSRKAAHFLNLTFQLVVNNIRLL